MKMTPFLLVVGGILVSVVSIAIMVIPPVVMIEKMQTSDTWRPMTSLEQEGHDLYVRNGCSYCHSLFIRVSDWGHGAHRIAQMGDYADQEPAILGSERTGPDLSQESGEHPDDWHLSHFINPRNTNPRSVMPSWEFLGRDNIDKLISYVQYLGGTSGDLRIARQQYWKQQAIAAYQAGPDSNITWIHSFVPEGWRVIPNPYPATPVSLERGHRMYQDYCMGCHGPVGDGQGQGSPWIYPPPLNFTTLRRNLIQNKYIGGILYYQIMNGITGTAMPYFKKDLESEKIWDISNYVAVSFIGYSDADIEPKGIDASYEPRWQNPYTPPDSTGRSK